MNYTQNQQRFTKKSKLPHEQIGNLKSRGLIIQDEQKAINYLSNIGYFRLSAYFYPLLSVPKEQHIFKPGVDFEMALNIYKFDRKLRMMIFNEIEKIEIAIRTTIVDIISKELDDVFWITNPQYFMNMQKFNTTLDNIQREIDRSAEDFITHFKTKYSDPQPPAWMIAEIVPLGVLCNVFTNLTSNAIKKKVAQRFGIQHGVFHSWILTLAGLRNMCCHHVRTWNKRLILHPTIPNTTTYPFVSDMSDLDRIYCRLCIVKYFISTITPNNKFTTKLKDLLKRYPNIDIRAMGFPTDWQSEPLWQ
jgi:abortive infection bacteriophage resistance protein